MERKLFTSESVTEGHPDKMCDQISDAILDAFLKDDPNSRVACEVAATKGLVFIFGEITSDAVVDCSKIARDVIKDIGYTSSEIGFDADTCSIVTSIGKQSQDISIGVNNSFDKNDLGAGDQGMVFGYACDETPELMPLSISIAHKLARKLAEVRRKNEISGLRPDGKTQVTIEYEGDKPCKVDTIVISAQHDSNVDMSNLKKEILEKVVIPTVPFEYYDDGLKLYVNPTGRFEIGGPLGDSGLTGRKIIVDTYGGFSRHGGGAFSGKDPTKVDRSAAYMARYIAKNVVASGIAKKCEIQISYAIGMSKPVSVCVDTFGSSDFSNEVIEEIINKVFDLTPAAIINTLDLRKPIYKNIACYGHMGRTDVELSWEKTDKIDAIETALYEITGTGMKRDG